MEKGLEQEGSRQRKELIKKIKKLFKKMARLLNGEWFAVNILKS